MFPPTNLKLLTVVAVTLATCSNLLVSAAESCGSDKYWSDSTAQCENCASICFDTSRRSMECTMKCPDVFVSFDYPPSTPPAVAVKDNPPAVVSAVAQTYSLPLVIAAVVAFVIVILVVGGIVVWRRRARIMSCIRSRSNDGKTKEQQELKEIKVALSTDGNSHSNAELQISPLGKNPLIQSFIDQNTRH